MHSCFTLSALYISIHAPRTGSDIFAPRFDYFVRRFQSTLPARGATARTHSHRVQRDFNPRSPHGERLRRRRHASLRRSISIHAPRTGSDAVQASLRGKRLISIHAPRTGSDCPQRRFPRSLPISIHAPRTGSDPNPRICQKLREDFNPRSPHGERRLWRMTTIFLLQISIHAPRTGSDRGSALRRRTLRVFQSTLPARGATRARTLTQITDLFQSTLPARGATRAPCESSADRSDFNPRSPHGERHRCQDY